MRENMMFMRVAGDFALFTLLVASEESVGVGRDFGLEEVAGVELAEELDDFALSRCVIAELLVGEVPGFADGAFAVEEAMKR